MSDTDTIVELPPGYVDSDPTTWPEGWDKRVSPQRYLQLQAALAKGRATRAQMKQDREAARAAGLPDPYRRPPPAPPPAAPAHAPEDPTMAARRKTQMPQTETPADDGPNPAKVQELMTAYQQVNLEIKRRSFDKKWWGIVDSDVMVATSELVNLRPRVISMAGGGTFLINVRDPNNLANVVYNFYLHIEGAPHVASGGPTGPSGPHSWQMPAPQPYGLPAGSAGTLPTTQDPTMGYPPYQYPYGMQFDQWGRPVMPRAPYPVPPQPYYPPPPAYGPPPSQDSAVTLLMQENATLKADVAKKDEKLTSLEDKFETRFKQMQDDATRAREEAREERYRADMRALEAKLDGGGGGRRGGFMSGFEAFAPVLATVLPAMISSRGESSRAEAERAITLQKMSTDQQMNLLTMLLSNAKGEDKELLKYLMDTVRSKADERVAGTESQIMMLKALGDFIERQAGPDEPWWLGPVKEILSTMQAGIATATMSRANQPPGLPGTASQGLPGAAPAPQAAPVAGQPQPAQPAGAPQQPQMTVEQQRALAQWENFKRTDEAAARLTFEAYQSPAMIPDLDTWEWRALIFNLHMKLDPPVLAEIVADHLEHLRTFNLLPQAFVSIFQQPKNVLTIVLKLMPISRVDPKYTEVVLEEIVGEIEFREKERKKVEAEEAAEAAEEAKKQGGTNGAPVAGGPS